MSDTKEDQGDDEKIYGGCEGPDAMFVKLVSSDGHEFIVKRDHALTSGTIKAMLSGPGKNPRHFDELFITARKRSLRRLCFYMCLSVHLGGGCLPHCMLGYTPSSRQTPPRVEPPQ